MNEQPASRYHSAGSHHLHQADTVMAASGKLVPVTVSGTMSDVGSGVNPNSASYRVQDEYGSVQPSGAITLGAGGGYSFTVMLEASRRGNDRDGRHYSVTVSVTDNAGNNSSNASTVIVPHDGGH